MISSGMAVVAGKLIICLCLLLSSLAQRGWLGEWIQPQKKTLGAMDFGGASTQITFETGDTIENPRNEVMLKLYGQAYKVYTHSFLCYGRDQVLKRLLSKLLQVQCVLDVDAGFHDPTVVPSPRCLRCPPALSQLHTFTSQLWFCPQPFPVSPGLSPTISIR